MKNIIIVESPSKSKTIEAYMGTDFKVVASNGHIRDLATTGKGGLGIDIEKGFIPKYSIMKDKSAKVRELKKECAGNRVYLATDPDREGEAISWHLAKVLDLDVDTVNRVVFNEITKDAVLSAFANPRHIDVDLVQSQETRRMLDRIIGFQLSSLLQRKIKSKSAGRVQSSVLKIIVDLEREIRAFVSKAYYELQGTLLEYKIEHVDAKNNKIKYDEQETALKVLNSLTKDYIVKDIIVKPSKSEPRMPLITSTLQQEAATKYGFAPDRTMRVAQSLYEGKDLGSSSVGLITYMRTDSTRLSDVFVSDATSFIKKEFGEKYLGKVKQKNNKNSQDAHEAVRPTSVLRTPDSIKRYLTTDEYKIYSIIYNRSIASLMSAAIFENTIVVFNNNGYLFKLVGQRLQFDGYKKIYGIDTEDKNTILPKYNVGDVENKIEVVLKELFTKPKARFTQASLIKEMEELGIGRPSTYAQTIKTLLFREYVVLIENKIHPTEQGELTTVKLEEFFLSLIDPSYTASMESVLDDISRGEKNNIVELTKFYDNFYPLYQNALEGMEKLPDVPTGESCPQCGSPLVYKKGRYGEFVACGNYPECKYIQKDEEIEVEQGIVCPVCRKGHIVNRVASRGKNKGNVFYACDNFPKCKTAFDYKPVLEYCAECGSVMLEKEGTLICSNKKCGEEPSEEILCPNCKKGHLVEKEASRGKNKGNIFYACDNFPKCKTLFTDKPINKLCPICNNQMVLKGDTESCSNDKCDKFVK